MHSITFVLAGPGDEGLLTVRGHTALEKCDLALVDPDVHDLVAAIAPGSVVCISDDDGIVMPIKARTKLLKTAVAEGKKVVRVLAGDPVLDGRLTTELSAAEAAGLPVHVAPGISQVTAIAAHLGISLTGTHARDVRLVDASAPHIDWSQHVYGTPTLFIRNAGERVSEIAKELMLAGWPGDTPITVVHYAGTVCQRSTTATLNTISVPASSGTGVLVVGEVASGRSEWFERRPLHGWRIVLPTTKDEMPQVITALEELGAIAVRVPTMLVEPPRSDLAIERAVHGLIEGRYEWLLLTSANAAEAVLKRMTMLGLDSRTLAGVRIAAIGEDTIAALAAAGIKPDLRPDNGETPDALLDIWPEYDANLDPIDRVLVPRADLAIDTLVSGLTELGWSVDDVTAFRTVRANPPAQKVRDDLKAGAFDAVLFTSASTVRNLVGIAGKPHPNTVIACIGPKTAKAAEDHGLRVSVIAAEANGEALVAALGEHGAQLRDEAMQSGSTAWRPSGRRRKAGGQ